MSRIIFFLCFLSTYLFAQKRELFSIDSLPDKGILLDKGWKYQTGDNPEWAKADFDDSAWTPIDPTKDIKALPTLFNTQIKWLRLNFEVKNKLPNPLGIAINQAGASEIYLNGRLIHQYGHLDRDSSKVKAYDPLEIPIYIPVDSVGRYCMAVRYALQPNIRYTRIFTYTKNRLFNATLVSLVQTVQRQMDFRVYFTGLDKFKVGFYMILFVFHWAYYLYQRGNKTHLLIALYCMAIMFVYVFKIIGQNEFSVEYRYFQLNISNSFYAIGVFWAINVYYRIAKEPKDIYYYILIAFNIVYVLVSMFSYGFPWQSLLLMTGSILQSIFLIRLTRIGLKKDIKGFLVLSIALLVSIVGIISLTLPVFILNWGIAMDGYNVLKYGVSPYFLDVITHLGNISLPVGLSLFMGIQGNEINKALSNQLAKNDQLKNELIEHEQEKRHILTSQNEMLEKQVTERTAELQQSLETLKSTQDQLIQSEKLASLGELTAGIAHEIQNPLNFVNNFSELSVDLAKELDEELNKALIDKGLVTDILSDLTANQERINHHGKRASSIVKGMLEHSRASTGVKELTDINKLADEYLRLSYHGLRAKDKKFNANFTTNFDETLPKINLIPQDIGRVLLNIINNAFYAVNERKQHDLSGSYSPSVVVSTKQGEKGIAIRVQDNGTGMPESVKSKIFQPFFTTKPTGQGTGLGLSLAYDIVTKGHGGTLEVTSIVANPNNAGEEGGTAFLITLPFKMDEL